MCWRHFVYYVKIRNGGKTIYKLSIFYFLGETHPAMVWNLLKSVFVEKGSALVIDNVTRVLFYVI